MDMNIPCKPRQAVVRYDLRISHAQTEEMLSITDFQHEIQTQNFPECHRYTTTFRNTSVV
jgi:hypothetical protein